MRLPLPSADDLHDVPGFIRRCFRRLALTLELPWALVLDNMQELGPAPLLHAGIAAALLELPRQARLIIISREPPAPAYARALAGQQLAVIETTSLRFTDAEAQQLVTLHGRDWQPAALRQPQPPAPFTRCLASFCARALHSGWMYPPCRRCG